MDKQTLRAMIREKKRAMTEEQIVQAGIDLGRLLQAHPAYKEAKSIFGYLPYNQEVRTLPMLSRAQRDGKRVAVPKIVDDKMIFLWINDFTCVERGYCGIPEPIENGPEAEDDTALVLMPGLAFDKEGRRCGYGGGFYDRWLAEHPGHPTLALCYGFQLFEKLDTDDHDIPVDFVLSCEISE